MPGMTALVKIYRDALAPESRGFWIPAAAVMEDSSGLRHVWIVGKDMKAARKQVETGPLRQDKILVFKGLAPGDRIAVSGVHFLTEGMSVKELEAIDGHKVAIQ